MLQSLIENVIKLEHHQYYQLLGYLEDNKMDLDIFVIIFIYSNSMWQSGANFEAALWMCL